MIVISHDREFLDVVTNVTLHIDNGKLTRYGGNYSTFEGRARCSSNCSRTPTKQQGKDRAPVKFITRFKAKATKAKQAQSRSRRSNAWRSWRRCSPRPTSPSNSRNQPTLPNPMLAMQDASSATRRRKTRQPARRRPIIVRNVSKAVTADQRIGILGANGQNKVDAGEPSRARWRRSAARDNSGRASHRLLRAARLDVLAREQPARTHGAHGARQVAGRRIGARAGPTQFPGSFNFTGDMVSGPSAR